MPSLLLAPAGSGKTALAATLAQSSDFPLVKLISPSHMVGYSDFAKVAKINKVRRRQGQGACVMFTARDRSSTRAHGLTGCRPSRPP